MAIGMEACYFCVTKITDFEWQPGFTFIVFFTIYWLICASNNSFHKMPFSNTKPANKKLFYQFHLIQAAKIITLPVALFVIYFRVFDINVSGLDVFLCSTIIISILYFVLLAQIEHRK